MLLTGLILSIVLEIIFPYSPVPSSTVTPTQGDSNVTSTNTKN